MRTALARRRRSLLLAACAVGLTISASACKPQTMICGVIGDDPGIEAGSGGH